MDRHIRLEIILVLLLLVTGTCVRANGPRRDTVSRKTEIRDMVLLKKGDRMPNYVFEDVKGKRMSLKKFRGKYVYIDIWATWCSSCIEQTPYFEELEEKFHNKNIAFVSVSVDKHRELWERVIRVEKRKGIQWIAPEGENSPVLSDFGITAIPRFILLDRKGKILDMNFGMPAWSLTGEKLSGLKGI